MNYFHRFTEYLDRPVSMPLSLEINHYLFSFVQIQVKVRFSVSPLFSKQQNNKNDDKRK